VKNETSEPSLGSKTPSSTSIPQQDKPEPIRTWQLRYERYLLLTGRNATRERYARVLEGFLGKYPEKVYPHEFLRPVIMIM
jgi:hypothetical protein